MKNSALSIPPTIYIRDASLTYDSKILFDNINLTIRPGKVTCLLGPSGVGKTTLLRMIAGLAASPQHCISCDNTTMPLINQIAYLPQQDTLLPWMNALDNTLLGFRLRANFSEKIRHSAKSLFSQMGLEGAETKFPQQLSGGMRQRVALIRTLLEDKPIVLMDEPFAALDAITRFQLQNLASELLKNRTVFLVTHDPLEALRIADEIYILAGQPADLTLFAQLTTSTPRDLSNPDVLSNQAPLFEALTKAKEISA